MALQCQLSAATQPIVVLARRGPPVFCRGKQTLVIVLPPRWTGLSVFCQTAHTQSMSEQQSENYFSAPHHFHKQYWPVSQKVRVRTGVAQHFWPLSQKEKIFCFQFCFKRRPNFFSECIFAGAEPIYFQSRLRRTFLPCTAQHLG